MIFQFGSILDPFCSSGFNVGSICSSTSGMQGQGLIIILNNLLKMTIVLAGVYTFWNLITAGFLFLGAAEAKQITRGWDKIWQSLVGLLIIAGSFVLAAIFGLLIFGDASMLITPRVIGPQ